MRTVARVGDGVKPAAKAALDREMSIVSLQCVSRYPILTDYLLIPLDPSVFDEMEVMTGPKTEDMEVEAVQSILSANAPSAAIVPSNISIR